MSFMRNMYVGLGVKSFLSKCDNSIGCARCGSAFKDGSKTSYLAQVNRMKRKNTLTGGVLCERCSRAFVKWFGTSKP
jgi:ribosomal protein L34E